MNKIQSNFRKKTLVNRFSAWFLWPIFTKLYLEYLDDGLMGDNNALGKSGCFSIVVSCLFDMESVLWISLLATESVLRDGPMSKQEIVNFKLFS